MPRGNRSTRLTVAVSTVTVGMLALAACTAPAPEEPADGLPHLAAAIDRLPDRITALLGETGVPGLSVAVVHGDETVYAEGFGVANLDTGELVDADTVFQLASVSKPVGATVIGALMADGELDWATNVQGELPWFALGDQWVSEHLQLGDLYSHRSGLPDHAGDDLDSLGVDQATILERLRYLPLTEFRTHYAYTNLGIQAGAMAAATAAGGDWMQLSEERLYTPLGMERTTSSFAEYVGFENHSVGHSRPDGEWIVTPEQLDDDVATAAGGVASSAHDMALWLRMLLAGGAVDGATVVDPDALAEAMTAHMVIPQHPANPAAATGSYGRGFQVGVFSGTSNAFVSHSGAFAQGAGTIIGTIPALDVGVVVLSNGEPIGLAESVAMEILDWAQNGELTLDWWGLYENAFAGMTADFASSVAGDPPAGAAPAGEPGRYTGTFSNDYFGLVEVAEVSGGLELTLSADAGLSQTWALEPYDGDVFRILIDNENATPRSVSAVTFDPAAGTVTIEFFDESSGGAGTFTRGS